MASIVWDDEGRATRATKPNIAWDDEAPSKPNIAWDPPTNRGAAVTSAANKTGAETGAALKTAAKSTAQYFFPGRDSPDSVLGKMRDFSQTVRSAKTPAEALQKTAKAPITMEILGTVDQGKAGRPILDLLRKADPGDAAKIGPDVAGNINLDRLGGKNETRNVIAETAETAAPAMEAARRGTISHAETQELARTLGMTADDLLKRRKGQAFNAEEAFAARELMMKSGADLIERAKAARGGGDEAVFAFKEALTKHQAIQEQVAGMTAEAGRALSQFNIRAGGALREDAIRRLLSQDRGRLADIADKMSMLDDPAKAAEFASRASKATTFDKIYEIWINSLLSGPQTHVVNVTSNALTSLWTIPETAIAAGYGRLAGGADRVYFREATAKMWGFAEGTKEGLRLAAHALKTGDPMFEAASKLEMPPRYKAIPGPIGEAVRLPGRFLAAEDDFFKAVGYRMELNALAMRDGLAKGLKGKALAEHIASIKAAPPEGIQLKAIEAARYLTYTRELGEMGSAAQRAISAAPAARIVMPFVRTPTNIMKFALERSPAAPVLREVREALAKGGPERQQALARITLGSSVGAAIATMAAEGKITGGGPSDPGKKAALYATGWQPYSVKIGDTWYSYGRLEPLGMILGISADFGATAGQMSEIEADEAAAAIAASISKNLVSKTWLSGLSDLISALEDPDQFGPSYVRRMAGTLVPTGVAQIERTLDPVQQDARSVTDTLKSRLPGVSDSLPPRRDIFGAPREYGGGLGPDLLSPIYTSKETGNKAAEEMADLGVSGATPTRKIENVDLTPEQYSEYVRLAGEGLQKEMEAAIASDRYQLLSDDAKVEVLEKIIRDRRKAARAKLVEKFPDLAEQIGERSEARQKVKDELKAVKQPQK
jgi:hypothetical protein